MKKLSKGRPKLSQLIVLVTLVGTALVGLTTTPSPVQADCGEGGTCADFVDQNGVEFEVCELGAFLQFWDDEMSSGPVRLFTLVEE